MTLSVGKEIWWATALALLMHLLLFVLFKPASGNGLIGALVPPETRYMAKAVDVDPGDVGRVRTVWSPVIFSLPSDMGFSRELYNDNLRTKLTFSQEAASESFLDVDTSVAKPEVRINTDRLMLTESGPYSPAVPEESPESVEKQRSSRRVHMSPLLKERLVGGVVLPAGLNRKEGGAWQVKASVSLAENGAVRHVFLDEPMTSQAMNFEILQMLYGLRFKSGGEGVEGSIEIYSPEPAGQEVEP